MIPIGSHGSRRVAPRVARALSTTALSASGSRKAPDLVVPCRRASQPSIPSLKATTVPTAHVAHVAPWSMIIPTKIGVAARRPTVTALAGVARAEGPYIGEERAGSVNGP